MEDTMHYLFGPLNREYCIYFYALSVFGFVYLIMFLSVAVLSGIYTKKVNLMYWVNVIAIALGYFIFYFQNRLLHTMCTTN